MYLLKILGQSTPNYAIMPVPTKEDAYRAILETSGLAALPEHCFYRSHAANVLEGWIIGDVDYSIGEDLNLN